MMVDTKSTDPNPIPTATNTLLITQLSSSLHYTPESREELKTLLEKHGSLKSLVPFKAMSRYIAIFESTQAAIEAKLNLDNSTFKDALLRIYFGQHSDLKTLKENYLKVPEIEKNFLLSPPGSPPLDWIQERESEPCKHGHHSVLDDLTLFKLEEPILGMMQEQNNDDPHIKPAQNGSRLILEFEPVSTDSLPTIVVENMEGEALNDWKGGGVIIQQTKAPMCFLMDDDPS